MTLPATDKSACENLFQVWDHDPAVNTALVCSPDGGTTQRWVDMRDYLHFDALVIATILAGAGPTLIEIVAAEDAAGTHITQVKSSGVVALTTLASWAFLECSAEEVAAAGAAAGYNLRYVAARITLADVGDEAMVVYRATARYRHDAITSPVTIA